MNELNYQCSCGLCFFDHDKDLIEEHHKLTNHSRGKTKTVSSITKKIINDNYAVFRAFDVVDGDITPKQYFEEMTSKGKGRLL